MDILHSIQKLALSDDKDDKKAHEQQQQQQQHDAPPHPAPASPKHENVFDKLSSTLGGSHSTPPPPPVAVPAPAPKHESVFDKIGDALGGSHHSSTPPAPAVAHPQAQAAHAAKKDDGFLGKIGGAISGRKTPPPPPKEQNLFDKLSHVVSGKEEQPAKPQGFADKINHAFGGGAKGEANEDKLDKAIDLFQEHILKEGDQANESALEQAKDEQIADTIRHTLGLPEEEEKEKK